METIKSISQSIQMRKAQKAWGDGSTKHIIGEITATLIKKIDYFFIP